MKNKAWEYYLVGIGVAVALFLSYYAVVKYHFASPPGDDIFVHLHNTVAISQQGLPPLGDTYPSGLYLLIISVARLLHISILQAFTFVAPALLPLSGITVWLLARRLFNPMSALITFGLFEFVTLQPLQTYFDGSLPNLFAAGILLPLFFLAIISWVDGKRRWVSAVCTLLLLAALIFSHHLTLLIALATLVLWGVLSVLVMLFRTKQWLKIAGGLVLLAVGLWLFGLAFANLQIFAQARGVFLLFVHFSATYPFISSAVTVVKNTWDSHLFGLSMGGLVFQGGVLGFFLVLVQCRRFRKSVDFARLLISIWFLIYWIGATHQWAGEPTRLARDLALPATILGGWAIWGVGKTLWQYYRVLAYVFIGLVILLAWGGAYTRIQYETANTAMVRFSQADDEAYKYLKESGQFSRTTVLVKELVWQEVVLEHGDEQSFAAVAYEQMYPPLYPTPCYLVGWYEPGAWPPTHADHSVAESYFAVPGMRILKHFSDPTKEWFFICQ
jgi:hypothetical protein